MQNGNVILSLLLLFFNMENDIGLEGVIIRQLV